MGKFLLFAAVLAATIAVFFVDSLQHIHRSDAWAFFQETMVCDSFAETVTSVYSYARSRHFAQGDIQLFRPLLLTFLCLELALFGANHTMPWQATALVLHFVVALLLMVLLLRLDGPRQQGVLVARPWQKYLLPLGVSLLFAINCSTQEQVIWTHLTAYVLFAALVLLALWLLLAALEASEERPWIWRSALAGCWAATALAAFTYELGVFFALLLALATPFIHRWRSLSAKVTAGLVFLLIPAGYAAWNELDWLERRDYVRAYLANDDLQGQVVSLAGDSGLVNSRTVSLNTLNNAWRYFSFALLQPFFPNAQFFAGQRLYFAEHTPRSLITMLLATNLGRLQLLTGATALVLWWSLLALGFVRTLRGQARVCWPVVLLSASCMAGHMGLIVFGRMVTRHDVLSENAYYPYFTFLFFLVASFPFVGAGLQSGSRLGRVGLRLLPAAFVLLALEHGMVVRQANIRMVEEDSYCRGVLESLNGLLADKGADYRFAVNYAGSDSILWYPMIPLPTVCFHRWIDQSNPVDVAAFRLGKLAVRPFAEVRPREGAPPYYRDFLGYDEFFVYWGLGNKVFAASHRALPGGKNLVTIEDATLAGVRQQARDRIRQRKG